jgi:hypothetical protein
VRASLSFRQQETLDPQENKQPGVSGLPAERSSNSDCCAIELGERKAIGGE